MKKFYTCLSIGLFLLASLTASAQVLEIEDFEDDEFDTSPPWPVSYGGEWSTSLPGFSSTGSDPCEGTQSMRRSFTATNDFADIDYTSIVMSGDNDVVLSFQYKVVDGSNNTISGDFGEIELFYTLDDGTTWTSYDIIDGSNMPTSDCSTHTATIPAADITTDADFGWKMEVTRDATEDIDFYVYVDDFRIIEQVGCIQPINIETTNITFDSVEVSWEDLNNPDPVDGWEVEIVNQGAPVGLGFDVVNAVTFDNPDTFNGLVDGVDYDVYVRALCGPGSESAWAGPQTFQTIAIGTDCENAIEVNADPSTPVAGDLPYTDTSELEDYGNSYEGNPGSGCSGSDYLDGYDVVYHYVSYDDDILQIDVSGIAGGSNVGVFVYESCADIGNTCFAGATTNDGSDFGIADLYVTGGQDYYIVISTPDVGVNIDYTLDIDGFDCATWEEPDGPTAIEFYEQYLSDFSESGIGINPTIGGATLQWYEDDAGTPGTPIDEADLSLLLLNDGDVYWVSQVLGTCESDAKEVTFNEFDCVGQLGINSTDPGDAVCDEGIITLEATANTTDIYWYDAETGGEVVGTGNTYTTDVLDETTSFWAAEVFFGEGLTTGQANPGPTTVSNYSTNNGLLIDATDSFTIVNVEVFVTGAGGDLTVELRDDAGNVVDDAVVNVPGGSGSNPTAVTVPLNFELNGGEEYRLLKTGGPQMIGTSSGSYPYAIGNAGEVINGATASGTSAIYYYFYNWTIRENQPLCESEREEVVAVVHEIIDVDVDAVDMVVCVGESTDLTASSSNTDYDYTWTWDGGSDSGATITVSPVEPTTYTVFAVDTVTGCENEAEITLDVIGTDEDLAIAPDTGSICVGESIELTAGSLFEGFEADTNDWDVDSGSSENTGEFTLVTTPHTIDETEIYSNDNSQFYLSDGRLDGQGSTLEETLTSPSFNLVGVSSASVSFYHYYRHRPTADAMVQVSADGGSWTTLETFEEHQGEANDFVKETVDLSDYADYMDVRVRFAYDGTYGYWWAIDNVSINRNFVGAQVTWDPATDLYTDSGANNPYTAGDNSRTVYFYNATPGDYTFTATMNIASCGLELEEEVTVTVNETPMPVGDEEQYFEEDATIGDLDVTGTDLTWYVENEAGDLVEVPEPDDVDLVHEGIYYVTQTLDFCESELLVITAYFNCPVVSDLEVTEISGTTATINWTEPAETDKVEHYYVQVLRASDMEVVWGPNNMLVGWDTVTVDGLEILTEYIFEIYTICDGATGVTSTTTESINFETNELSIDDINFAGFAYHPNPTSDVLHISNTEPIDNVEVYNMLGQKVMEQKGNDVTSMELHFGELATGVYMTKVTVGESVRIVRIIKE